MAEPMGADGPAGATPARRVLARCGLLVLTAPFAAWGVYALAYGSWARPLCLGLAAVYAAAHLAAALLLPWRRATPGCA